MIGRIQSETQKVEYVTQDNLELSSFQVSIQTSLLFLFFLFCRNILKLTSSYPYFGYCTISQFKMGNTKCRI